jgi:hypothetical protein
VFWAPTRFLSFFQEDVSTGSGSRASETQMTLAAEGVQGGILNVLDAEKCHPEAGARLLFRSSPTSFGSGGQFHTNRMSYSGRIVEKAENLLGRGELGNEVRMGRISKAISRSRSASPKIS